MGAGAESHCATLGDAGLLRPSATPPVGIAVEGINPGNGLIVNCLPFAKGRLLMVQAGDIVGNPSLSGRYN